MERMEIKAGKVYRDGDGSLVHIMGPTRTTDDVYWSLEGNHYTAEGRMVHRTNADRYALCEEVGEHGDGGKGEGWAHSHCTACKVQP